MKEITLFLISLMVTLCAYAQFEDSLFQHTSTSSISENELDNIENRNVWFIIFEYYGIYSIMLFYGNEYNQANGEDL